MSTVLLCGAGQLGSRYLQGLARCSSPLQIHVHDVREEALVEAGRRWNEVQDAQSAHALTFGLTLESLPRSVDIAIVAATADVRPRLVGGIAARSSVRFWLLEKLLAQNEAGLDQIISHVGGTRAWVNTPRRIMPWYTHIRTELAVGGALTLKLVGADWGLACNAVHFLDLVSWMTGETIDSVGTEGLEPEWIESKRRRFFEVFGTLDARFSRGSHAVLSCARNGGRPTITIDRGGQSWRIDEPKGVATRSDGLEITGRIDYQSEMTAGLVQSILERGDCGLPSLTESAALHRIFLRGMQLHWGRAGNLTAAEVPIT
jgi:hypothetical protein